MAWAVRLWPALTLFVLFGTPCLTNEDRYFVYAGGRGSTAWVENSAGDSYSECLLTSSTRSQHVNAGLQTDNIATQCCSNGVGSRPGCQEGLNWADAAAFCTSHDLMLCSVQEVAAAAGSDAGCAFDNSMVWTTGSCDAACEHGIVTQTVNGNAPPGICCPGPERAYGNCKADSNRYGEHEPTCWTDSGNNWGYCAPTNPDPCGGDTRDLYCDGNGEPQRSGSSCYCECDDGWVSWNGQCDIYMGTTTCNIPVDQWSDVEVGSDACGACTALVTIYERTCNQYCQDNGLVCVGGWEDADDESSCEKSDNIGCGSYYGGGTSDQICKCGSSGSGPVEHTAVFTIRPHDGSDDLHTINGIPRDIDASQSGQYAVTFSGDQLVIQEAGSDDWCYTLEVCGQTVDLSDDYHGYHCTSSDKTPTTTIPITPYCASYKRIDSGWYCDGEELLAYNHDQIPGETIKERSDACAQKCKETDESKNWPGFAIRENHDYQEGKCFCKAESSTTCERVEYDGYVRYDFYGDDHTISDVYLIEAYGGCTPGYTMPLVHPTDGYGPNVQDLNDGVGGKYIYICYSTTGETKVDSVFLSMSHDCPGGEPVGTEGSLTGDLNQEASTSKPSVYLCMAFGGDTRVSALLISTDGNCEGGGGGYQRVTLPGSTETHIAGDSFLCYKDYEKSEPTTTTTRPTTGQATSSAPVTTSTNPLSTTRQGGLEKSVGLTSDHETEGQLCLGRFCGSGYYGLIAVIVTVAGILIYYICKYVLSAQKAAEDDRKDSVRSQYLDSTTRQIDVLTQNVGALTQAVTAITIAQQDAKSNEDEKPASL